MLIILFGNKKDLQNDEISRHELKDMKQEQIQLEGDRDTAHRTSNRFMEYIPKTKSEVKEIYEIATESA